MNFGREVFLQGVAGKGFLWYYKEWIFLLDIYDKDEQDDLTAEGKRQLAALAVRLREEALRRTRRS